MHDQRTVDDVPPESTVWGLGVCDALRVQLAPVQLSWLIDELEELRGPLEEQLQRVPAGADREALMIELAVLRRLRAQVPAADGDTGAVLCGPAETVATLVRGALRNSVAALAELVHGPLRSDSVTREELRRTAAAAAAWTTTYLDRQAIEGYAFDPS
jgi:hypothetical protein